MKIKSQFKDYYDHIAFMYGGGDPKIVYPRHKLIGGKDGIISLVGKFNVEILPTHYYGRGIDPLTDFDFKWLIVNARKYLCIAKVNNEYPYRREWKIINEKEHKKQYDYIFGSRMNMQARFKSYMGGKEEEGLLEISRILKAPVFCIIGDKWLYRTAEYALQIEESIPILSTYGLASLVPPEQLYQDLAYFMGNKIHISPDLAPPVTISDKDKIVQYGFDLKSSFRHPVK